MWADMALKQGDQFDINGAVFAKRDERERSAKSLWDTLMKYKAQGSQAEVHDFAINFRFRGGRACVC